VAAGVRRKGLTRSLLFAIGAFVISNIGTAAMDWLKQLAITPTQSAAVSTGIGLSVVVLTVVLDSFKEPKTADAPAGTVYSGRAVATVYPQPAPVYQPAGQYPPGQPVQAPPAPAPPKGQRRVPWVVALVVILVLCGVGGFAVTWGVQWANGQAICIADPKHYQGVERLAGPAAAASGQLRLEVTGVMVSKCGTVLTLHAVNSGDVPLVLPVFGNTSLTVPGRTSLGGDPRTSDWNETVPARGEMTGVLVFKSIPGTTSRVRLSFNTVFGRLQGPSGISVDIPLATVSES
jgi:hypothetical protein